MAYMSKASFAKPIYAPGSRHTDVRPSHVHLAGRQLRQSLQRGIAICQAAEAPQITAPEPSSTVSKNSWTLVCPICMDSVLMADGISSSGSRDLECKRCNRSFGGSESGGYLDLTLNAGMKKMTYSESWQGTDLFRRPLVSSIYERGWRQGFSWAGAPGADKEFAVMLDYLKPHYGEDIVDLSCGSGLFTRRFLSCGKFPHVMATDFSDSMLQQTQQYIDEDKSLDPSRVTLVKADIHRLPFQTASLSAVHAGAAIHCWQTPSVALAEISRVLKPGGSFVGSTFLDATAPLGSLLGNDEILQPLRALDVTQPSAFRWWSEPELVDLFKSVGLQDFQCTRYFRYILWSVRKP